MFTISQRLIGLCETFREKYQRPGTLTLGVVNAIAQVSVVLLKHIEDRQQLAIVPASSIGCHVGCSFGRGGATPPRSHPKIPKIVTPCFITHVFWPKRIQVVLTFLDFRKVKLGKKRFWI